MYKALSEAEKYNKVTSLTVADVCMFYFEIEVSQTQSRNKSQNHIHYLPEIDPMPILIIIYYK